MSTKAFNDAFEGVKKLVETFQAQDQVYISPGYNEAQARKDFIDKFFIALGWDVNHEQQMNPYQQEVKVERAYGGVQRRADYAFYLAPDYRDVRFYVEAKKPSGAIATDGNCFQAARYGYGSKNPLSILTDFVEFLIIDCRYKPALVGAHQNIHIQYKYVQYTNQEKFAEIYWLFSHEAVAQGSIEKYAAGMPKPRGKATQRGMFPGAYKPVDESLLEDLDEYRTELAHSFKKVNPSLDSAALTEITQRTLDRLVFLRFLEDKQIELEPFVDKFGASGSAWGDFSSACRRLDGIYNGTIFKRHGILDAERFRLDDGSFADICERLCHLNSPYNFDAIPIHILGSIYERFLGKVIVATAKQVRVDYKPEVRKAGGVYYTPEYIVRYIVENTVGKLIEGKTPDQISEMRFADIACGSGSFLLGVYDLLLRYHGNYYNANPKKSRKGDYIEREGRRYLSLRKKRDILLNNIHGVDIDSQAVEVAQLSLYLKLLQEETIDSVHGFQLAFNEALLPSLAKNIICGNSLIGTDILEGGLFPPEEEPEFNPMNFEDAFPRVMKDGGFDAIVGNPPYRRELNYKHLLDRIALGSFGRKYRAPRMDLWYYFVHRGLEILKPGGLLSFIVNAYWTSGTGAEHLITAFRDTAHLDEVFFLGKMKVFQKVSGQHMILRASNARVALPTIVKLVQPEKEKSAEPFVLGISRVIKFEKSTDQLFKKGKVDLLPSPGILLSKIEKGKPISELGIVRQGIAENPASINRKTNERFGKRWRVGEGVFALSHSEEKHLQLSKGEEELLRPYHDLCDIERYWLAGRPSLTLIYSTRITCPKITQYPHIHAHLERFRPVMEVRRETLKGANSWWHLHWPRDEQIWQAPKIVVKQMARRPCFSVARRPVYVPFSVNVFVPDRVIAEDLNYFTGLMNSKLLWVWFSHYAKRRGVGLEINGNVLARTPIRIINFSDPDDKDRHDRIVSFVEQMVDSKMRLITAKTDKDKGYYKSKCTALDRQIDRLVYDLYGLNEDEIQIVEKGYE